MLQKYLTEVKDSLLDLSKFKIKHIPREENSRVDLLSYIASTKKASIYHSVAEKFVPILSFTLQVESDWRTPLIDYVNKGVVPEDEKEVKQLLKKATRYTVFEGHLFKRGVLVPLLKCIGPSEV